MSASTRALGAAVLLFAVTACFPGKEPDAGFCSFSEGRGCRPGLMCRFDDHCVEACTAPTALPCDLADGGAGRATCSPTTGWTACSTAPCSAPVACVIDGGAVGYVGTQVCLSDAGYDACREDSACSRTLGVCARARRVVGDEVGCTALSYALVPEWRAVETCAENDGRDNDCDGYVDELADDDGGADLACGVGVCGSRGSDGRLLAYRTCSAPSCSTGQLSSLFADAGYLPLDLCDGVDRDCSGVANAGRAHDLLEGTEVAVQGDENTIDGEVYRVVASRVADAGLELVYFRIGTDGGLSPPSLLASGAGPFWPQLARTTQGTRVTSLVTWLIDGGVAFTSADNFAVRVPTKITYSPRLELVPAQNRAALVDGNKALIVSHRADGGVIANNVSIPVVGGDLPINWEPHALPLSTLMVSGNGTRHFMEVGVLAGVTLRALGSTSSADIGRQRDGGTNTTLPDGGTTAFLPLAAVLGLPSGDLQGFGFAPLNEAPSLSTTPDGIGLDAVDSTQVYATLSTTSNVLSFWSFGPLDEEVRFTGNSQQPFPNQSAKTSSLAAIAVDGGVAAIYGARTNLDEFHLHTTGKLIDRVEATPSMAWSSKNPRYVLIASPERRTNGVPVIRTRMVCAPTAPFWP